jgi:hypothetical protein
MLLMSFTSLEASMWKCLKEGSAEREKHCRFSMAFTSLKRDEEGESETEKNRERAREKIETGREKI